MHPTTSPLRRTRPFSRLSSLIAAGVLLAGAASAQTTHVVNLNSLTFSPANITITVGDTVQWVWNGLNPHNVESGVGGVHDGIFRSGDPVSAPNSYSVTFDQAFLDANPVTGKLYNYYCINHLPFNMVGSVKVNVPASGSSRNAGTNPNSLSLVNPPQIGGMFLATQDLSTTGHALGAIVGFASPLTFPLAGGQTLLVNVTDPLGELLGQSAKPGPLVNWTLAVPNDPGLCGFSLSVQGIQVGGVQPFALSNALDVVVGS